VDQKVILGGEPLLNPTILDWMKGLHTFWPNGYTQILTNGYYLDRIDGLKDACRRYSTWIGISKHSDDSLELIESKIENFLGGISSKEETGSGFIYRFRDLSVTIWEQQYFYQNGLITGSNGYKLHNSDPTKAHSACPHVLSKNYHFSKGTLYKCAVIDLLPELDKQIRLDITDEDRELLKSYQPLTVDNFEEYQSSFFDTLDNVTPQCKFCPEIYQYQQISATSK
jgi:hypothetical protein